jgi:hypothetical protein
MMMMVMTRDRKRWKYAIEVSRCYAEVGSRDVQRKEQQAESVCEHMKKKTPRKDGISRKHLGCQRQLQLVPRKTMLLQMLKGASHVPNPVRNVT